MPIWAIVLLSLLGIYLLGAAIAQVAYRRGRSDERDVWIQEVMERRAGYQGDAES